MPSQPFLNLRNHEQSDLHNKELLKACAQDEVLLGELFEENKAFIMHIVKEYLGGVKEVQTRIREMEIVEDDLIQKAYLGMKYALDHFDFSRDEKFTTFCFRPIVWEINKLVYNEARLVPLNKAAIHLIKEMYNLVEKEGLWDFPSVEVMAEKLAVDPQKIREVLRFATPLAPLGSRTENNIALVDKVDVAELVTTKLYVQDLINNSGLSEFEKNVAKGIMEDKKNAQIAKDMGVYPMTITRTIERIRKKFEDDFEDQKGSSKYRYEIELISEEMEELQCLMKIEEMKDLLDVCGFDMRSYTARVLYYIRQKATKLVSYKLTPCG